MLVSRYKCSIRRTVGKIALIQIIRLRENKFEMFQTLVSLNDIFHIYTYRYHICLTSERLK